MSDHLAGDGSALVELGAITRTFGAQRALDDVTLDIAAGEIHSLVGENGAGKSTLGKILSGSLPPTDGSMRVGGRPVRYRSPADALKDGIVTMHQEISLAQDLTVLDNVVLGLESRRSGLTDRRANLARFEALRTETGFDLDPRAIAGRLSLEAQQEVEILRALARDARLIIMDEPTAALSGTAVERLHRVVRSLRERGTSVVYISHFLDEVVDLSDRVTVLRNGQHVTTLAAADTTADGLVRHMLGRSLEHSYPPRTTVPDDSRVVLHAQAVRPAGSAGAADLTVRAGEVVGLFGLVGSGRSEFAMTLFGAADGDVGSATIDGEELRSTSPRASMDAGLMLLPESRKEQGLFLGMGQRPNASIGFLHANATAGVVRRGDERTAARSMLERMGVDPVDLSGEVGQLSGGNQQKVLFAKCLFQTPRVLILDEPTRGVDVGSRRSIYDRISELVADGMAVVVISSDLDEVIHLSHRLLVMRNGSIVGDFDAATVRPDDVLDAAFGLTGEHPLTP